MGEYCTLMGSQQPALEKRRNAVHRGHGHVGGVARYGKQCLVVQVPLGGQPAVAAPAVGSHFCAGFDRVLYEGHETRRRGVRHPAESHPSEATWLMDLN